MIFNRIIPFDEFEGIYIAINSIASIRSLVFGRLYIFLVAKLSEGTEMKEERLKSLTNTYTKYYLYYLYMVEQIGKGK